MSIKSVVKIIASVTGLVTKKVTDDKTKKVTYVEDYNASASCDFSMPLSVNHMRRVGRAIHIAESYLITIQKDKVIDRFEVKVTAKMLSFKRANKVIKINRTKTLHTTRKTLDVGVDLQELITYLISDKVLNYSVSRKRVVKKAKDQKHAEYLAKKAKMNAELAQLRAEEKNYLASLQTAK